MLDRAAVLGTPVGQDGQQTPPLLLEPGQHPVIEPVGGHQRLAAVIQLGEGHLAIGIDEGLLVDPPNPLERANIERILGAQLARMLGLNLALRFLLLATSFQRRGQHPVFLSSLLFQPLVPLPDRAHPARRDKQPPLLQFVGHPPLPLSRVVQGKGQHCRFHPLLDPGTGVNQRLLAADLLPPRVPLFFLQLLKPVEAVPSVAHHPAGLADVPQPLSQLQPAELVLDDLLLRVHLDTLSCSHPLYLGCQM